MKMMSLKNDAVTLILILSMPLILSIIVGYPNFVKIKHKIRIETTRKMLIENKNAIIESITNKGYRSLSSQKNFYNDISEYRFKLHKKDSWGSSIKYGTYLEGGKQCAYLGSTGPNKIWDSRFSSLGKPKVKGDDIFVSIMHSDIRFK